MSLKNWSLNSVPQKSLNDGSSDYWTASGSGTSEYYYNQTDVKHKPLAVYENGSAMTEGTLGSLNAGEWAWGDNDSLGRNTIYVRLSDGTDPDIKTSGYVKSASEVQLLQGGAGNEVVIVALELFNKDTSNDATAKVIRTDSADSEYYSEKFTVPKNDGVKLDTKIMLNDQDKIKIMSTIENVCVVASGDES